MSDVHVDQCVREVHVDECVRVCGAPDAVTCLAFQHCVMSLCSSSYSDLGLQLITDVLSLRSSSYWLVRTELLETLAETDFRCGRAPRRALGAGGDGHQRAPRGERR